jgi:retinal rod rhodopsin-sensitive cGMP 3',5'-cyclic phosphodiesterase subunit delta
MSSKSYEHKYDADPPNNTGTTTTSSTPTSTTASTTSNHATELNSAINAVVATVSTDPVARKIAAGFRINYMTMSDASTGVEVWNSGTEWDKGLFENELEAHVPGSILECPAVAREINFTSVEELENFRLEQRVYFQNMLMEEWFFDFGFVIPQSTNTWSSTIEAAGEGQMLPASLLNGKVKIVTSFFEGPLFVGSSSVRVFYDK